MREREEKITEKNKENRAGDREVEWVFLEGNEGRVGPSYHCRIFTHQRPTVVERETATYSLTAPHLVASFEGE